jgi:protein-L-isoaspartate(D-aspartate) O-methyltransferase
MVETEVATAGVKNAAVLAAMRTVPRHEFVPADLRQYAYFDMALPIGEHQTISPPFIVAWMTQQIDPRPTDRVLEVGTGSGYQAALLSPLVKEVYTIEIVEPLARKADAVFKKLHYKNVELKIGDGFQGWPEHAPFDKILVTCSPEKIPSPLIEQLREGGRMLIPLGERFQQTLYTLRKVDGKLVTESREPTFFVPMTGKAESLRTQDKPADVTPVANGDFEHFLAPGVPVGWYYLRQATIEEGGPPTSGNSAAAGHCLTFRNRVVGRNAQVLQALGVDGRQAAELVIDLWIRARDVGPPKGDDGAKLMISFFDDDRGPVGMQTIGPWTGSLDWQRRSAHVKVPPAARTAILGIGLLGVTGELSVDQVQVRMANPRAASR